MPIEFTRNIEGIEDKLSLLHMSAFPQGQGWKPKDFKELLAISFHYILIDYDINNTITGFLVCSIILDEAEILTFSVAPSIQRTGRGFAILAAFLEKMTEKHIQSVFLEVAENNISAVKLYKQFGFSVNGKRSKYYDNNMDALLMIKTL